MIKILITTEHAVYGKSYQDEYEMKKDLTMNDFIMADKKAGNKFCLIPKDKIIVIHVFAEEGEHFND